MSLKRSTLQHTSALPTFSLISSLSHLRWKIKGLRKLFWFNKNYAKRNKRRPGTLLTSPYCITFFFLIWYWFILRKSLLASNPRSFRIFYIYIYIILYLFTLFSKNPFHPFYKLNCSNNSNFCSIPPSSNSLKLPLFPSRFRWKIRLAFLIAA